MTHQISEQDMAELWAYRLASDLDIYADEHHEHDARFVVDKRYDTSMPVVSAIRLHNEDQFIAALQVRGLPFTRCASDDGWEIYISSVDLAVEILEKLANSTR